MLLWSLSMNGEIFHPEDNAHDIVWRDTQLAMRPTKRECTQLNKLMGDIYALPGSFDPCAFVLLLDDSYLSGICCEEIPFLLSDLLRECGYVDTLYSDLQQGLLA